MEKGFSHLEYTNAGYMYRNFYCLCCFDHFILLFTQAIENHKTIDVAKACAVPYSNKYGNNDIYNNIGCV